MEQKESVPFSALIAGMLLYDRNLKSTTVVNMMSKLEHKNIYVDDVNDNLDVLYLCVDISSDYGFGLKPELDYDTILYGNVTVYKFLVMNTNSIVLSFLGINCFDFEELETVDSFSVYGKGDIKSGWLGDLFLKLFSKKNNVKIRERHKKIVM